MSHSHIELIKSSTVPWLHVALERKLWKYGVLLQKKKLVYTVILSSPNWIPTVWKDWNFIYDVKVSFELNSAILLFRPDGVPMSRQRLHSPFSYNVTNVVNTINIIKYLYICVWQNNNTNNRIRFVLII